MAADGRGGAPQYVNWCAGGGSKDAFFTSDACHQLYMNHVQHFVNRRARPDPARLCHDGNPFPMHTYVYFLPALR